MTIWEHTLVVCSFDVKAVHAEIDRFEPDGFELVSMVQIAMATAAAKIDQETGLVIGSSVQPMFLLIFKRPKPCE